MIHHHLKSCESTQEALKEYFQSSPANLLVSTDTQVAGRGRLGNNWFSLSNSLAFSFTVEANCNTPSLTSLEIGVALCEVLSQYFQIELSLKWPNDLINQKGFKVGGILLQSLKDSTFICGIGLNWNDSNGQLKSLQRLEGQYPAGALFETSEILTSLSKKQFSLLIAEGILAKLDSLRGANFYHLWEEKCFHMNRLVEIRDSQKIHQGIFKGIGPYGEAILLENNDKEAKIFSGSLFVL